MRAQIISALEQAGYRNSEDNLPLPGSGGTFSAIGGSIGVNVTWRFWGATEAELADLRAGIAAALRAAGFEVHELDSRLHVAPSEP